MLSTSHNKSKEYNIYLQKMKLNQYSGIISSSMSHPDYFMQFSPHADSGFLKNYTEEFFDEELNRNQDFAALFAQLNAESEGEVKIRLSSADQPSSIFEWNLNNYIQNERESDLFDELNKELANSQLHEELQPSNAGIQSVFNNTSSSGDKEKNQESDITVKTTFPIERINCCK